MLLVHILTLLEGAEALSNVAHYPDISDSIYPFTMLIMRKREIIDHLKLNEKFISIFTFN